MKLKFILILPLLLSQTLLWAQERTIYVNDSFKVYADRLVQGEYVSRVTEDGGIASDFENRSWKRTKGLEKYPAFSCSLPIGNALYTLATEELDNLIEKDTTWRTGKWWGGVWTRDVSYSSLLAVAYMNPEVTRVSLMRKVQNGRILEDTGTGGSWPVSTDRVVWTLAAWQLYLVTGDEQWLHDSYTIIKNTLLQDEVTVFDTVTGLLRGESTFLDWREETYPRWMQPADISQSECLGTNAVYFRANQIASRMAQLCGDKAYIEHFAAQAERVRKGINEHLWIEEKGYYGQYLYGRSHLIVSPRSETLGEALCVIFGIADSARAKRVISRVALTPYGTPCISPQIPNIYPYHNNAVWPFVQSYWLWACATVGNAKAVEHSMAAICRPAMLFATWQENFVAENGDYHTAMNSPNMLWSIAGALSMFHRQLMGINFTKDGLVFRPFVPEGWQGPLHLSNFKYRKSILDITVEGFGDSVKELYVDGKRIKSVQGHPVKTEPAPSQRDISRMNSGETEQAPSQTISKNMRGAHKVRIVMNGRFSGGDEINLSPVVTSVETPYIYLDGADKLAWRQVPETKAYRILCNGREIATVEEKIINGNRHPIAQPNPCDEYQVIAIGKNGTEGFASEPLPYYDLSKEIKRDMKIEIAHGVNEKVDIEVDVTEEGDYWVDFRYANGSDNLTDNNRSCNRTLVVDGKRCGIIVFPQRGKDLWQEYGFSSGLRIHLSRGRHTISLQLLPANENMSAEKINRALLDYLRIRKI